MRLKKKGVDDQIGVVRSSDVLRLEGWVSVLCCSYIHMVRVFGFFRSSILKLPCEIL